MSKHPKEDDAPPSYTESTTPNPTTTTTTTNSPTISTTLTSFTSLLRITQAQQSALESHKTTALLPLLTPHLTNLLTRLGTTPHPPALAEVVFVPAAAVGPEWSISSDMDRSAGELVQVVRVVVETDPDSKGRGRGDGASTSTTNTNKFAGKYDDAVRKPSDSQEFDDWGRWQDDYVKDDAEDGEEGQSSSWWNDQDLARRLARQLRPDPKVDRTVVRAVMEQAREEKKASRWGLFRPPAEAPSTSSSSPPPPQSSKSMPGQEEDVSMTVRAEEVTFRKENEMGIWESTRGWGIVARVRIRR